MTIYAVVVAIALCLMTLAGLTREAVWTAVGVLSVGSLLAVEYQRLARAGRREGRGVPPHRDSLDRIVAAQWLGAGLVGLLLGLLFGALDLAPLDSVGHLADALIVGLAIAVLGIFVSSLVDWYLVLPKVSGIAGPAPCETRGGEGWRYVTCIWYAHRAIATMIVWGVATGVPAYMGSVTTGGAQVAWAIVAGSMVAAAGLFGGEMFRIAWYALNPPVYVGGQVHLRIDEEGDGDGDVRVWRRRGYVADVSIQGSECKALIDGRFEGESFASKGDRTVPNDTLPGRKVAAESIRPLCEAGNCCGVNFYCRNNPAAHA